jgi:hypothetical protein
LCLEASAQPPYGAVGAGSLTVEAESCAKAQDPMNLIQVMLAKGDVPRDFPLLSTENYDRNKKFF